MEPEETNLEREPSDNINEEALLPGSFQGSRQFKRCITIEPILFAFFLAESLSDSVTVNFLLIRTCEIHFNFNKSICDHLVYINDNSTHDIQAIIQPYSATLLTAMNFLSILFSAVLSAFIGPWSDYNGRKLVIVISAFGYFLKNAGLMFLSFFPNLGPEFCLLAVIPVALSGGVVNFISSIYAYISDISLEKDRSFRISLIEAIIFLSVDIGYLCSSYIFKVGGIYGSVLIYGLSAFIIIIVTVPTYFFLPESVQTTESGKGLWHVFEFKLFQKMLQVCFRKREGYQRSVIFLVITCLTISISIDSGESNIIFLFMKLKFGWGIEEFNLWISVVLAVGFIGIIFVSYLLGKWLRISDTVLGMLCYSSKAFNSFYIALIPSTAPNLMFYSALITIFGGLCGPICRAILSKIVPKEDFGKVFALTSSCESIFPLAVGPLYTILYNETLKTQPNAFLFLTGSFFVLCFIFFKIIYFLRKANIQTDFERLDNENENGILEYY